MSEKGNMPSELAEQEKVKRPVVKKKANELMAGVVEVASVTGKKSIEVVSNVISQTASGSKVLASEIAKGAKDISEKAKEDSYKRRLKKYNPLFVEEYNSPDFFVPNIICIVDDAVRRDIDVCQGAIGWREKKKGTEVLFLYDEFVNQSGLDFVPMPVCDEVYYVDSFEKKRYIKLDCVFQQAHEEKLAELEYIAYSLGAKSCTVQIEENEVKHDKKAKRAGIKENLSVEMQTIATKDESAEIESVNDSKIKYASGSETKFKGNDTVVVPKLKWFAHDNNIRNLIEYRINRGNEITSKTLRLSGSSSATMSRKAACSVDAAVLEMNMGRSFSMEAQSIKENTLKIIYHLEF
ncbi:MAG: hypothetical protein U0L85_05155 [Bacilli bacterium]|nr:hypothetical protein [Bacilli bacterium]